MNREFSRLTGVFGFGNSFRIHHGIFTGQVCDERKLVKKISFRLSRGELLCGVLLTTSIIDVATFSWLFSERENRRTIFLDFFNRPHSISTPTWPHGHAEMFVVDACIDKKSNLGQGHRPGQNDPTLFFFIPPNGMSP